MAYSKDLQTKTLVLFRFVCNDLPKKVRELSETSAIASVAVDLGQFDYTITDVSQRLDSLNEVDANGKYKYGDWKVNIAYI